MIKISDYIMNFLKEKGVREIFMLPGGGAMHLLDSMGSSGIDYICFQHEQGAAIAAEAYGQHTNEPGCLLVTSIPPRPASREQRMWARNFVRRTLMPSMLALWLLPPTA